ncbi:MAG: hypothetical protein ACAH20_18195 [Methylobacteriaceae bacterium]
MSAIARFIAVTTAFREITGLKTTALSWRLFGDSKKLGALEAGADIHVTRYEKALQWLSDNWPLEHDALWPADVARPLASVDDVADVSAAAGADERAKPLRCLSPHGGEAFVTEGQSR